MFLPVSSETDSTITSQIDSLKAQVTYWKKKKTFTVTTKPDTLIVPVVITEIDTLMVVHKTTIVKEPSIFEKFGAYVALLLLLGIIFVIFLKR